MIIRSLITTLALAAVGGAGASLQAQGRDTTAGQMGMPGMMMMMQMCPMVSALGQGPGAALGHADELELSAAQRQRLEALRSRGREAGAAAMREMREAGRELRDAMARDTVDSAAVRTAFRNMADAHARATLAALAARRATRDVLTAEQRQELARLTRRGRMEGMGEMRGMMGMMGDSAGPGRMNMMQMMMQQCPMMRGMMGDSMPPGPRR